MTPLASSLVDVGHRQHDGGPALPPVVEVPGAAVPADKAGAQAGDDGDDLQQIGKASRKKVGGVRCAAISGSDGC